MAGVATPQSMVTSAGDEQLVEAIIQASRAMMNIAARSLAASDGDVTIPQYRTLVVLAYQGPRRLADLAAALGVSPSTATRMCDRLVRKGLIDRTRDEFDRREVNLGLTDAGRRLVGEVVDRRRVEVRELLHAIPEVERPTLLNALGVLATAAGEGPEPQWSSGWNDA